MKLDNAMAVSGTYGVTLQTLFPNAVVRVDNSAAIEAKQVRQDGETDDGYATRLLAIDAELIYANQPGIVTNADGTHVLEWNLPGEPIKEADIPGILSDNQAAAVSAHVTTLLKDAQDIAMQCVMAGVVYPNNWKAYVVALKALRAPPYPDAPAVPNGI